MRVFLKYMYVCTATTMYFDTTLSVCSTLLNPEITSLTGALVYSRVSRYIFQMRECVLRLEGVSAVQTVFENRLLGWYNCSFLRLDWVLLELCCTTEALIHKCVDTHTLISEHASPVCVCVSLHVSLHVFVCIHVCPIHKVNLGQCVEGTLSLPSLPSLSSLAGDSGGVDM